MANALDLARAEAILVLRCGGRGLLLAAIALGVLALVQDPPFARRQELDLAWSSIEALLVLVVGGGVPWIWLSAQSSPVAGAWVVRCPAPTAAVVGGAWVGLVAVGLCLAGVASAGLFTLDRILGHGVPGWRVLSAVGVSALATAVLSAWGLALRWLAPRLAMRGALWLAVLAVATGLLPVGAATLLAPRAPWYSLLAATIAGLWVAHALLLRRRAVRH